MNTIGDRLYHARITAHERFGLSSQITMCELADGIDVSAELIYREESNLSQQGEMSAFSLMKAAEYLACSFLWLATGRGEMLGDDDHLVKILEHQCGQPVYLPDEIGRTEPSADMRLNVPGQLAALITRAAFYTVVTDNALQPIVSAGDLVLVDAGQTLEPGKYVLVKLDGFLLPVVRRFAECNEEQSNASYQLCCLNDDFAHRPFPGLACLLGVVMEFRRFPGGQGGFKNRLKKPAFSGKVVAIR